MKDHLRGAFRNDDDAFILEPFARHKILHVEVAVVGDADPRGLFVLPACRKLHGIIGIRRLRLAAEEIGLAGRDVEFLQEKRMGRSFEIGGVGAVGPFARAAAVRSVFKLLPEAPSFERRADPVDAFRGRLFLQRLEARIDDHILFFRRIGAEIRQQFRFHFVESERIVVVKRQRQAFQHLA